MNKYIPYCCFMFYKSPLNDSRKITGMNAALYYCLYIDHSFRVGVSTLSYVALLLSSIYFGSYNRVGIHNKRMIFHSFLNIYIPFKVWNLIFILEIQFTFQNIRKFVISCYNTKTPTDWIFKRCQINDIYNSHTIMTKPVRI
jgi:hypothetical protein